jgi:hypothetical protein
MAFGLYPRSHGRRKVLLIGVPDWIYVLERFSGFHD